MNHKAFWVEYDRWTRFRSALCRIIATKRGAVLRLHDWVTDEVARREIRDQGFHIPQSQCYRIADISLPPEKVLVKKPHLKTLLLMTLRTRKSQFAPEVQATHQNEFHLIDSINDELPHQFQMQVGNPFKDDATDSDTFALGLETLLLMSGFDRDTNQRNVDRLFENTAQLRAMKGAPVERYYDLWRYSTKSGMLVKAFLVLHAPTKSLPLIRFSKFHLNKNNALVSCRGLLLAFTQTSYMIGVNTGKTGIFVNSFSSHFDSENSIAGLCLEAVPQAGALSARTVMRKSSHVHSDQASTGLTKPSIAREQLQSAEYEYLRNEVPFCFEQEVFRGDTGTSISEDQLVSMIEELVTARTPHLLHYTDGRAFNPAKHKDYTFNAALSLMRAVNR